MTEVESILEQQSKLTEAFSKIERAANAAATSLAGIAPRGGEER